LRGRLAPRDPARGSCHGCPFVSTVVLDLAWWGAGGERTSATRPFGRGDSNTKVNRQQFGALTRRTRPDLLPRHRKSSNQMLWLVSVPSRQGGAEKVRNPSKGSICQKLCSLSWFQGLSRLLVARTDNCGGGWPRRTQRRDPATVVLLFRLWFSTWPGGGAGGERTSATRPFGRGDSNTKVNRQQFGALTRRTRPDLLPRHRKSSNQMLWLVSVPSRQGGAEKVRNPSKGSICQKLCSAGFKA
jgi:hypothetical protein